MKRIALVIASLALAATILPGCGTAPSATPTISPDNPLVPANAASATVGGANENANEVQQQVDDLSK